MTDQITKILIVDDEASLGRLLKAGLEMHGFTVRFETRSTDAIKTCLEFDPDLVLLDVDMPVKDGGMVAAEMKGHPALGRTPVIFLTSLVRKEETAKPNASGEIFLSKPIPIPELVARIRIVLHYRLPPEPLVPCFPRNPVRLSSFGAFHGAGRSRAQFAMGFVGIAMESQSVDGPALESRARDARVHREV